MPDNNTDKPATAGDKSSGPSNFWAVWLVVIFLIASLFGLRVASESRPAGALAFLMLFSLSYFIVPQRWRTLFKLSLVSLVIGVLLLTVLWELAGNKASESMDAPTIFAFVTVLLLLSLLVGAGIVALLLFVGTSVIIPWVQTAGGHADMKTGELRKFLIRSYLRVNPSYLVFAGSKVIAESPKGVLQQVGGPGLAIIKPETAVVFEYMGYVSQVTGPGVLKDIKMFEMHKAIIDLRPQWDTTELIVVSTQDGEQIQVSMRYQWAILKRGQPSDQPCPPAKIGPMQPDAQPPDPGKPAKPLLFELPGAPDYCAETIRLAAYESGPDGCRKATSEVVRWALRTEIERRTLEELFPAVLSEQPNGDGRADEPNNIAESGARSHHAGRSNADGRADELNDIAEAVQSRASQVTQRWGVGIDVTSVDQIIPPATVTEATRSMRQSRIEAARAKEKGEAEAAIYAELQTKEVVAQQNQLGALTRLLPPHREDASPEYAAKYLDLLTRLVEIVNSNRVLDYRHIEALEAMSQNPNARIIIQPGAQGILVEHIVD